MIPGGGDQSFYDSFKANEQKELNPETNLKSLDFYIQENQSN